jgi:hypothetical protein
LRFAFRPDQEHPEITHQNMELVDGSGQSIREDKCGFINHNTPPNPHPSGPLAQVFIRHLQGRKGKPPHRGAGAYGQMRLAARKMGRAFIKGFSEARGLYLKLFG